MSLMFVLEEVMEDYCNFCHQEKSTAGTHICPDCLADRLIKGIGLTSWCLCRAGRDDGYHWFKP